MKSTGIVRKLDNLGRVVVPIEMRRVLGMEPGDPIEIQLVDGQIVVSKHKEYICECCGADENLISVYGVSLCAKCLEIFNDSKNKIMNSIK